MPDVVLFPLECPTCKTQSGQAQSIDGKVRGGVINVWVRCTYCNQEWRHGLLVTTSTDSGIHRKPHQS